MNRTSQCRPNQSPWSAADGGLSRILSEFVGQTASSALRSVANEATAPALTAWETDSAYTVELDLPGITPEAVSIELLDGTLTVSGSWPREAPEGAPVLRDERPSGEFSRTVQFSNELDEAAVEADLRHGTLRITLPKRPETQPRKIHISPRTVDATTPGEDDN